MSSSKKKYLKHVTPDKCCYCGCKLTEKTATLEHKTPSCFGGSNSIDNFDWACSDCNNIRGAYADYILRFMHQEILYEKLKRNLTFFGRIKKVCRLIFRALKYIRITREETKEIEAVLDNIRKNHNVFMKIRIRDDFKTPTEYIEKLKEDYRKHVRTKR